MAAALFSSGGQDGTLTTAGDGTGVRGPSRREGRVTMSQSQFVFLYRSTDTAHRAAMGSPEEMQRSMQAWMAWMSQLKEQGHIKDPGHPLERAGKVVSGKQKTVTDGPYAETKDIVGGYTLVEAKSLAHAVELSLGCPIFEGGGVVEVRPVIPFAM